MDVRRRFLGQKKKTSSGESTGSYTVVLNSQWQKSTSVANPDSSTYDGVYESNSNYNVNSTAAIMYIDISGMTSFKMYIRSYAESNFDYVMVSQLDQTINNSTSYSNTTLVKAHTRGNQQSGTAISNYTLVEFTGIDGGSHRITVVYRKDGSTHSGNGRGYVLIPKGQGTGSEEDDGGVDIDTTYSIMYTSSDGNVVTPNSTTTFGANITNNIYVNGQGIITFDKHVTMIGNSAFDECTSLTSVTIPDSVTTIGSEAFYRCTSLTSVIIPNSVTSIGKYAFCNCYSLTSVTIPDSVTSIGDGAFLGCTSLTSVTIPSSVTSIGRSAFDGCPSLTSVTIGNGVTSIGDCTFNSCISLASVTIPDSVTSIGGYAFSNCTSLTSITIPNSVTSIGEYAFAWCESLTSVTIPDNVFFIKDAAFYNCSSLSKITIGKGLSSVGSNAFSGNRIRSVYISDLSG